MVPLFCGISQFHLKETQLEPIQTWGLRRPDFKWGFVMTSPSYHQLSPYWRAAAVILDPSSHHVWVDFAKSQLPFLTLPFFLSVDLSPWASRYDYCLPSFSQAIIFNYMCGRFQPEMYHVTWVLVQDKLSWKHKKDSFFFVLARWQTNCCNNNTEYNLYRWWFPCGFYTSELV
jgi:hypothetical protein